MKYAIVIVCLMMSACATRHVPDTTAYFTDCPNKKARQADILLALLKTDDQGRRRQLKMQYYDFYRQCK
jgi:hypothetical protein